MVLLQLLDQCGRDLHVLVTHDQTTPAQLVDMDERDERAPSFVGDASFFEEFVEGVFFAQLHTNTGEQFRRLPRGSKYLVRAKIEAASSLCSPTLREENHACPSGGRITFDFGEGIAALDVGKIGGEKQKVDAGILNKLESFSLRGRYRHVITG